MALVNGDFLHYMDKKKFLKNFFSPKPLVRLNLPWVTLFKNCLQNFDLSINMALVNGGFLHYTDMKKFMSV